MKQSKRNSLIESVMRMPNGIVDRSIVICGNNMSVLSTMQSDSVDLVVTSPPYNNWRNRRTQKERSDYWERTNIVYDVCEDKMSDADYQRSQVALINELVRVLKPGGTICYNHKDQIFNFKATSPLEWILRSDAILRQRVTWDRCGMQAYNPVRFYRVEEDIYILGKAHGKPKWNAGSAKDMSVWRVPPSRNVEGHPATFPSEIVRRCVEAFTDPGDIVLDPYNGVGTTTTVATRLGRVGIGIDISQAYCAIAAQHTGEIKNEAE
jgi:DNA modification methylase